jgi:hypothetical protein
LSQAAKTSASRIAADKAADTTGVFRRIGFMPEVPSFVHHPVSPTLRLAKVAPAESGPPDEPLNC